MVICGTGLLAACYLAGVFLGEVIGVQANVRGVGIAMLFLILFSDALIKRGRIKPVTRQGVVFWSAIHDRHPGRRALESLRGRTTSSPWCRSGSHATCSRIVFPG